MHTARNIERLMHQYDNTVEIKVCNGLQPARVIFIIVFARLGVGIRNETFLGTSQC
jgi:hypothetical protein